MADLTFVSPLTALSLTACTALVAKVRGQDLRAIATWVVPPTVGAAVSIVTPRPLDVAVLVLVPVWLFLFLLQVLAEFGLKERGAHTWPGSVCTPHILGFQICTPSFGTRSGPWDHKPKLREFAATSSGFYTPIRGDDRPERLFYDVWSNIHYGDVGRAHGIPERVLMWAQRNDGGVKDRRDDVSVALGFTLWRLHRLALHSYDIQAGILAAMPLYRWLPGSVRSGWS